MRKERIYEKDKQYISVSQFNLAKGCQMRWYIQNVKHIKPAFTASTEFGNLWDAMMEDFLNGEEVDKYIEQSTIIKGMWNNKSNQYIFDFLKSIKDFETQKQITMPLKSGAIFIGDIDLYFPTVILDFKSTSNWNYVHNSKSLAEDPQMLMYGKSQKNIKELCHIQCNTRDYEIRDVWCDFNYDRAVLMENEVNAMSITLQGLRKQEIEHVKKTWSDCINFKCQNVPFCQGKETLKQLKERTKPKVALPRNAEAKTKLKEFKKEIKGESKMGFADKLKARQAVAQTESKKSTATASFKKPAQVEETETETEVEETEETVEVPKPNTIKIATKPKFGFKKKEVEVEEVVEEEAEEVPAVKPKSKFALKKKEAEEVFDKLAEDETQVEETEAEVEEVVEEVKPKSVKKIKAEKPQLNTMKSIVFVDCMPVGEDTTKPSEMLADDVREICEAHKIKFISQSKFNEAVKTLFEVGDDIVKTLKTKPLIYIDTKNIVDVTVLQMLLDNDNFMIVRGVQ